MGRTALVTGGSSGIGAAVVERLNADGWRVASGSRSPADQEGVLPVRLDVTSRASCEEAVGATVAAYGHLDLLVNSAGVIRKGFPTEVPEDDWDLVLDVNLKGSFLMSAAAIPHLVESGGSIVNIASDAGLIGLPEHAAYCASKGGLVLMTKSMAIDLAPHGVRVNAVCPSNVDTPMLREEAAASGDPDRFLEEQRLAQPQGQGARFITAGEVAALVAYLAGDEAAAITGAALTIDFGTTTGLF